MMKGGYGQRNAVTRMQRRAGGILSIRQRSTILAIGTAVRYSSSRKIIPRQSREESEPSRTEAKGQGFRFPRPCRLAGRGFPPTPDQFGVRQTFPHDLTNSKIESVCVRHIRAVVKPEGLFVNVAEQVIGFDRNVGAIDPALEQAPKVLQPVGMDVISNVLDSVIHNLMGELFTQPVIRPQGIAVQLRSSFHVLTYQRLQLILAALIDDLRANLAAAFQNRRNDSLAFGSAPSLNLSRLFSRVHVARFAADKGFVYLYTITASAQLTAVFALMREANAMQHEPCCFLGDTEGASYLIAADPVLRIRNEPNAGKPFIETERRIFEDRTNFDRELPFRMPIAALPAQLILEEANPLTSTGRTDNAVLPLGAAHHQVLQAVLGNREIQDGFLKSLRFVEGFHTSSLRPNRVLVKYIFTKIMADFTKFNTAVDNLTTAVNGLVSAGQAAGQPAVDAATDKVDGLTKTVTDATAALTGPVA